MLATTVKHQKEFDQTVDNFELLITGLKNRADPIADATANISNAAGTLGDLLADDRPVLKDTIGHLETIAQPLIDQQAEVDDVLDQAAAVVQDHRPCRRRLRRLLQLLSVRPARCKLNGAQPGGPVRTVKVFTQPTGRCTPQ